MALTFTSGSTTTTTSEADLFSPVTSDAYHGCHIFLHNMAAGDTFVFKVYTYDNNTTTLRVFDTITKTDAQTNPAFFVPMIPTRQYKITVQKTVGTNRAVTYDRVEHS